MPLLLFSSLCLVTITAQTKHSAGSTQVKPKENFIISQSDSYNLTPSIKQVTVLLSKMEKLSLVVLAFVGFGLSMGMELDLNAILHGSPAEVSGDAPRPCCSPTQFEGTLSELDTYYKKGGFFHHGKGGVVSVSTCVVHNF